MKYFQDTGILLFYGLFALLYEEVSLNFVFGFLCGLILLGLAYITDNFRFHLAAGIGFAVLAWISRHFYFLCR